MEVIAGLVAGEYWAVAVDSYRLMVMREGEGEDLAADLLLAAYGAEEPDDGPYCNSYVVGILAVRNAESYRATLDFGY